MSYSLACGVVRQLSEKAVSADPHTNINTLYPSLVCINGGVDAFGDAAHTRECLLEWLVVCMVLWRPLEQSLEQQAIARYVLHRPDHEALDGLPCGACAHGLCGCELAKGLAASL